MKEQNQIVIYTASDGSIQMDVAVQNETVWLNRNQLADLFDRDVKTIGKHVNNVFREGELDSKATVAKFATVQKEGDREVIREIEHYSLDVIISVGYRVKSKRGTQFRIWANQVLKDYLVQGYTINRKRLEQKEEEIEVLKNGVRILGRTIGELTANNSNAWLSHFAKGLTLLDDYDHEQLDCTGLTARVAKYPSLNDYLALVHQMRSEFDSDVFGRPKDNGFESSLAQIEKGFADEDFYPTIEEKAATLLYLVTKNHSFVDGNKRIAAACFLKFLETNAFLTNSKKELIISSNTLASLTLFVASSRPEEMKTVKQLVISVLNRNK